MRYTWWLDSIRTRSVSSYPALSYFVNTFLPGKRDQDWGEPSEQQFLGVRDLLLQVGSDIQERKLWARLLDKQADNWASTKVKLVTIKFITTIEVMTPCQVRTSVGLQRGERSSLHVRRKPRREGEQERQTETWGLLAAGTGETAEHRPGEGFDQRNS